jgi:hypothetical protein
MNNVIATLRANKWFVAALLAAIYLGYELNHTNSAVFHMLFRTVSSPFGAPGPFRLSADQHRAVAARLKAEFGNTIPFHQELGSSTIYFTRHGRSPNCVYGSAEIDLDACNDVEITDAGFEALLRYSNPETQHFMFKQTASAPTRGQIVNWFFFIGKNGRTQIILDLTRVSIGFMKAGKVRVVLTEANRTSELAPKEIAPLIYLADDPGPSATSFRLEMIWPQAPEMRPHNLGEVPIQRELQQRHRFFSTMLGRNI